MEQLTGACQHGMPKPMGCDDCTITKLLAENDRLKSALQFVERWANHHAAKPHVTAEEALSVIQHSPAITTITRGYADGRVPDTYDPYAENERLRADAERLDWVANHATVSHMHRATPAGIEYPTTFTIKTIVGANDLNMRAAIDAAINAMKNTK